MRSAPLAIALLAATPTLAAARPITLAAGLGLTQSKVDAAQDPSSTLAVFGRIALNRRVSAGLELQRINTDDSYVDLRTVTANIVVDLGSSPHLVPMLLAGAGLDYASYNYGATTDAHHFEGGFGLEYRADGGLVVGGDLRIGGRSIDSDEQVYPLAGTGGGAVALYAPSTLHDGEYRSARAYVGVRF
jgi:hypothetical protein